jgi:hypothetical protein
MSAGCGEFSALQKGKFGFGLRQLCICNRARLMAEKISSGESQGSGRGYNTQKRESVTSH